jgi:hypothetical protein
MATESPRLLPVLLAVNLALDVFAFTQPVPGQTYTCALSRPGAPATIVVPEIATERPRASPPLSVSWAVCVVLCHLWHRRHARCACGQGVRRG